MDVFEVLADPVRRALLARLAAGPARVVDLAADHAVSRPAVSRHLRVLTEAGLVHGEDRGRERHYRLDRRPLAEVDDYLRGLAAPPPIPGTALDALDTEVRRTVRERRADRTATEPTTTTTTKETA